MPYCRLQSRRLRGRPGGEFPAPSITSPCQLTFQSNPKLQQKADEYVRKLKLRAEEEADAVSVDDLE